MNDWSPFRDRVEFETAELLYKRSQMPAGEINALLDLWAASLLQYNGHPPFADHRDLYATIDSTTLGGTKWDSFELQYSGELPVSGETPEWMTKHYEVVFRDVRELAREMLANPDYHTEMDSAPFREFDANGERRFEDFMSGDWSWQQADRIAQDPNTHGAMFVPWIMGSDKTTVSVATGQNEYYPLYGSIGNSLKPGMSTPEVALCSDGHYRRVIYGLGPYIADYPEQALLACIVQGWCPKCTASADNLDDPRAGRRSRKHTEILVRELELGELWDEYGLVGDLVVIKGTFKDHIVTWVEEYLVIEHGRQRANEILDDINRRGEASNNGLATIQRH
ncbi:hypothetical protein EW026_g5312 [Hermanssonia centrifuga]|uniref:Uncharacterized protein n=1 Tax=Hermanssonia centrifuga TaxID=98765 RepID=A0A4S4KFI7_9APHY|nr:hypothetical protein EW026_g5312 [Hermanssonia centrifuga]